MSATTVKIDPNAIKDICLQNGKTLGDVSAQLGRSRPYLYTCCKNGSMSASSAKLFCMQFNVPLSKISPKEAVTQEQAAGQFHAEIQVQEDTLQMTLFCGSDMIQTAFSKLKGKSSLDLMQAISYAAHMMYKMEEQKALQEKRKFR